MTLHIRALAGTMAAAAVLLYVLGAMLEVISPWGAAAFVSFIFHILMAAQKLGNAKLSDSASTMIRRLSGDESFLTDVHGADACGAKR